MKKILSVISLLFLILSQSVSSAFSDDTPFRYFQDFSGSSVPKDSVFTVTEYTLIEDGTIKQKIKNSRGGYNLTLPYPMTEVYFGARAQFLFDISLELEFVSSSGSSEKIRMIPSEGKIYDTEDNEIGTIEPASPNKWRTLGVFIKGGTAFFYIDNELISPMKYSLDDLSVFRFVWVNETNADFRPKSDDVLISEDKNDFPTLPEVYTKAPELISSLPSDGAENVPVTSSSVVMDFKNPVNAASIDGNISVLCGEAEAEGVIYSLSEDSKRLTVKIADELEAETVYKIALKDIESEYGVKIKNPIVITFKTDDGIFEINNITFDKSDGIISVKADAVNNKKADIKASIILCLCKGTEESYYVDSLKEVSANVASKASETLKLDWDKDLAEGEFLKAFFWQSGEDMQPLHESVVIN